jgi:hypothetical protein
MDRAVTIEDLDRRVTLLELHIEIGGYPLDEAQQWEKDVNNELEKISCCTRVNKDMLINTLAIRNLIKVIGATRVSRELGLKQRSIEGWGMNPLHHYRGGFYTCWNLKNLYKNTFPNKIPLEMLLQPAETKVYLRGTKHYSCSPDDCGTVYSTYGG